VKERWIHALLVPVGMVEPVLLMEITRSSPAPVLLASKAHDVNWTSTSAPPPCPAGMGLSVSTQKEVILVSARRVLKDAIASSILMTVLPILVSMVELVLIKREIISVFACLALTGRTAKRTPTSVNPIRARTELSARTTSTLSPAPAGVVSLAGFVRPTTMTARQAPA